MDLATLQTFLGWCTVINMGLLLFSSLLLATAKNWVYGIHSKLFSISRESFNNMIYGFLGVYKLLIFVFCLVPWAALLIMSRP